VHKVNTKVRSCWQKSRYCSQRKLPQLCAEGGT